MALATPPRMSRLLVAYASTHGQTRAIAEAIAGRLRAAGHAVDLADVEAGRPPPPDGYDAVVLGSRVKFGAHARALTRYVAAHRAALGSRPAAFFSVSMSAAQANAGPDPHDYMAKLFAQVGWRPTRAVAFGGALAYRRYNWLLRAFMKRLSRAGGHSTDTSRDHVYTDWAAVERFADGFAADLGQRPAAPASISASARP